MPITRELLTDADFDEALEHKIKIRVFKSDHLIDSSTVVIRYTGETIITQSSLSDVTYHSRMECQFYEIRK